MRYGHQRDSGVEEGDLYWCQHTVAKQETWGENGLFCRELSPSWTDICDFRHCEEASACLCKAGENIIELTLTAFKAYQYSGQQYAELFKYFR